MNNDYQIETAFIKEELQVHGKYLVDAFIKAIEDKNLVDSGDLKSSFIYKVDYNTLSISFKSYGRIHDLKSKNQGSIFETPDTNAVVWGIKRKKKRVKDKRWYAKTAYGSLGRVTNKIMYGFSDQERQRIANQLQTTQTIEL